MHNVSGHILIIEDDPLVSMNYEDILNEQGYLTSSASKFAEAKKLLISKEFNLIICDHDLIDDKGTAVLNFMKHNSITIPVIYLSANIPSLKDELKKYNFVKIILCKPVDTDVILDKVNALAESPDGKSHYPRLINDEERNALLNIK